MLSEYPTFFDNTEILNPTTWDESFENVKDLKTTEAGKDSIAYLRWGKLTVDATYCVTSRWAKIFRGFSWKNQFTLKMYDVYEEDYTEVTVRMEDFKISLMPKSENIAVSNGIYEVSFKLVEF